MRNGSAETYSVVKGYAAAFDELGSSSKLDRRCSEESLVKSEIAEFPSVAAARKVAAKQLSYYRTMMWHSTQTAPSKPEQVRVTVAAAKKRRPGSIK